MKENYFHETSIIGENAAIGQGTKIWQFCVIMDGAHIGSGCSIGQGCFVENGADIGNNVKIKNNVAVYSGVECEDDVFLGPNCVFTNVINPRSFIEKKNEFKKTIIHKGATVGANATIVCGHEIGEYALIGAGAVVTRDIRAYALAVGNPVRQTGWVCRCGEKLSLHSDGFWYCNKCNTKYEMKNGIMRLG